LDNYNNSNNDIKNFSKEFCNHNQNNIKKFSENFNYNNINKNCIKNFSKNFYENNYDKNPLNNISENSYNKNFNTCNSKINYNYNKNNINLNKSKDNNNLENYYILNKDSIENNFNENEITFVSTNDDDNNTKVEEFNNSITIKEYLKKKIIIIDNIKYFRDGENIRKFVEDKEEKIELLLAAHSVGHEAIIKHTIDLKGNIIEKACPKM